MYAGGCVLSLESFKRRHSQLIAPTDDGPSNGAIELLTRSQKSRSAKVRGRRDKGQVHALARVKLHG